MTRREDGKQWTVQEKTPPLLQYDLGRYVSQPCASPDLAPAAVCSITRRLAHGTFWTWARYNIGHAAEILYKCWSFWHERSLQISGSSRQERLLVDTIQHSTAFKSAWATKMLAAMGARFRGDLPSRCAVLWAVPMRDNRPGAGDAWFPTPQHAWALTSQLMGSRISSNGLLPHEPPLLARSVRVGVLQRGGTYHHESSRDWPHSRAFVASLQERPLPGVESAEILALHSNLTLKEQTMAVRRHQIIVSTHGSHSVSLAFIQPCTVVIELLSASYLLPMFGELAIAAGGRNFMVFQAPSVRDALRATVTTFRVGSAAYLEKKRNAGNFAQLQVDRLREMVVPAIAARRRCLAGDHSVAPDGLPVMGFAQLAHGASPNSTNTGLLDGSTALPPCFSCYSGSSSCCESKDARKAYFGEGGYACPQCLEGFRAMNSSVGCAMFAGICRLPDMVRS